MAAPLLRNALKSPCLIVPAPAVACRSLTTATAADTASSRDAGAMADMKATDPTNVTASNAQAASTIASTTTTTMLQQTPLPEVLLRPPPPPPPTQHRLDRPCFFDSTGLRWVGGSPTENNSDPNKAKLGRTLRILQERMPTLLQSPLPQDILAPNISLHLFPTTHPHLPTVSGRVAYNAALWTSPIAWNRVPIIGNVKLEILAERVTSEPMTFVPRRPGTRPEQLVVRWCEKRRGSPCAGSSSSTSSTSAAETTRPEPGGIARALWRGRAGVDPNKAFTGLFIFDFDAEGRVLAHTIEQAQEGGDWEKGMGAKFVGLTDWLLGGMKNPNDTPIPMFEDARTRH
ncbi:Intracellular protein transport protein uso1 [Purpureocillium lavendulum]|uniref:Intracellular protein transport protein uso1 n=1 Tax=Purpureocillium lavendulum TaxID=1247861 RepID=A0AB34FSD6_9HYPO|nr:Intracellular protein transport protein uso1 [Purpureocillium lavendulum]